mgnify:CR=1 FL=1|jgi:hypothetical protein
MLGQAGKGEIKLQCKEQTFPEFPNLLFGQSESGCSYFDATHYLSKLTEPKPIQSFFNQYRYQIKSLCDTYDIADTKICLINEEGHYLIDGTFLFLFIAFVEPDFLAYMCDRTFELFAHGVAVSDTYLISAARTRLSNRVLSAISSYEEKSE